MRKTVIAMTALAVLGFAGTALAQDQAQDPRAAFMAACGADLKQYCAANQPGTPEMKTCVQTNFQSFSDPCKGAMMKMMQAAKAAQGGGDAAGGGGAAGQ